MRVLLDYRPALREPTGVGEYFHQIARAFVRSSASNDALTLFSSSYRDRLSLDAVPGAKTVDRGIPVRLLNLLWNRLQWPSVDSMAGGDFDLVQSASPLLIPTARAAQAVFVADLDFLDHPERTRAEIKRDYAALAARHATRADHVITISQYTAAGVAARLGVAADRITVAPPGVADWPRRDREDPRGVILFLGTLEPRKNLGVLLDAYERLIARRPSAPSLVLAGGVPESAAPLVARASAPPFAGRVTMPGYVTESQRLTLYRSATVFVLPSHTEGFGMPVAEAMRCGVPVVVANRGALPEVIGSAGRLFEPDDAEALAGTLEDVLTHEAERRRMSDEGWLRAQAFTWANAVTLVRQGWAKAIERRKTR